LTPGPRQRSLLSLRDRLFPARLSLRRACRDRTAGQRARPTPANGVELSPHADTHRLADGCVIGQVVTQ